MPYFKYVLICMCLTCSDAFVSEYMNGISNFFGLNKNSASEENKDDFDNKVLYEVSTVDEKFISEAAKITGVALSELDKCQQRIVLKLGKGCNAMNDEDISKMAVMLLNCQSAIEGRRIYPCTTEMSIKDCTKNMDSDIWNTYHLMANRVRAVCYTARQTQFIGLTEHTINKLVDTTRNQVKTLDKLVTDQRDLQDLAENTLESVKEGHDVLSNQQKDLERAHFYGQLLVESNLKRLADEKFLISQTHHELTNMAKTLQLKLEDTTKQLQEQSKESSTNHKEILRDLLLIQQTTHDIFKRIEDSSILLIEQSERAHNQYLGTLKQLSEVNQTVHSLANVINGTRQILEDRLTWISSILGGTDVAVDRLYLLTWHIVFIVISMIASSFINLKTSARIVTIALPVLNLAVGLNDTTMSLEPLHLAGCLIGVIIAHSVSCFVYNLYKSDETRMKLAIKSDSPNRKVSEDIPTKELDVHSNTSEHSDYDVNQSPDSSRFYYSSNEDTFDNFASPTPPLSRTGFYSTRSRSRTPVNPSISNGYCSATTRLGKPCKLPALIGRDCCHRHLRGDSIMG